MTGFTPTRIINAHCHYHPGELEQCADRWKQMGLVAMCMCSVSKEQNRHVLECHRRFGDFVLPFGYVDLANDGPDTIDRLRDEGFVGLKFHNAPAPYSDPAFFKLYERAAELKMPAVFHTGRSGRFPPRRSLNMAPAELEPICKALPEWSIIGAHLGGWWAHDAVAMMEVYRNVHFDLSGGFLRRQAPSWLRSLFLRQPERNLRRIEDVVDYSLVGKLVFATDNPPLEELLEFYVNFLNWLDVPPEIQERVYYGNMADILGQAGRWKAPA